jgi:membrane-associated phospholipid phosphatase
MVAMSTLDQPLQQYIQRHRSSVADNLAGVARRMGQVEVFGTVAGGMLLVGAAGRQPALRRAALRVMTALALAGTLSSAGKLLAGRPRPDQVGDADDLKLFSGHESLPSGHTTMAFALATSLANEIRRPWVTVGLLTAASGTGWSRLNDNKHWLSDVLAGAGVGIASAQLIDGRWTVFHLHPPAILPAPGGVTFVWRAAF